MLSSSAPSRLELITPELVSKAFPGQHPRRHGISLNHLRLFRLSRLLCLLLSVGQVTARRIYPQLPSVAEKFAPEISFVSFPPSCQTLPFCATILTNKTMFLVISQLAAMRSP